MTTIATTAAPATIGRNRSHRSTTGDKVVAGVSHTLLSIWTITVIVPFAWTLLCSFKTTSEIFASPFGLPAQWNFDNYVKAWSDVGIGKYFFNTVVVVGCALVLVMLLGAMLAYALARFKFLGNRLIYNTMLAAMTFPVFLSIVPLFFVLSGFGLLSTKPGLILVYVAFALPFTMFFLYSFFRQLPQDVYEAAKIDGAGEWRAFFSVMLPMASPGMASVAILNFLGLWNQFLLPVVLNANPENYVLSQAMSVFQSKAGYSVDFGALFAAVVMTVLPVFIVYIVFQRKLEGSVSQGTFR
ncbi:MAG: carbohydrate ABC transporter permease [Propionibacteriaceae bacterium]|jgi:N-acetylglucosamine transport system permease protein|nr:carbohydrate ABC transporter permease [Propionibacteriaceae bacterium]